MEPCQEGSSESGEWIFWGGTSSRRFHQLSQCWWNLVKKVPPSQVNWFSLVEPCQEGSTEWFELILSHGTLSGRFQQVLEPVRQVPLNLLVPFQVFASTDTDITMNWSFRVILYFKALILVHTKIVYRILQFRYMPELSTSNNSRTYQNWWNKPAIFSVPELLIQAISSSRTRIVWDFCLLLAEWSRSVNCR